MCLGWCFGVRRCLVGTEPVINDPPCYFPVEVGTVIGGWYQLRLFDFGNMKGSMVVGGSGERL